jgi:hypothetical protein
MELERCQPELAKMVQALRPASRLSDGLHRREQEPDQDGDDRHHDQQLDQRKPARSTWCVRHGILHSLREATTRAAGITGR